MRNPLIFCICLLLLGFGSPVIIAQNRDGGGNATQSDSSYIIWVKQFPNTAKTKAQGNIFKKISKIITGEEESPALVKPISAIALGPDSVFVADQGAGCIFEFAGNRVQVPGNLRKKFVDMTSLVGMCFTPANEILFTDSRLGAVYKISADRKSLSRFNDTTSLKQPTGIAFSSTTNEIWVVETGQHRIKVFDLRGKLVKTIGTRGTAPGAFNFPTFLWIDEHGKAYVVDAMNFRIQLFDSKGEYISHFGQAGDGSGYLARPKGIATDSYGNIYIADALFNNVQIFSMEGEFLYQFGRQGKAPEEFWMPSGIYIDKNNYIYVADSYNSRIQVFRLIKKH